MRSHRTFRPARHFRLRGGRVRGESGGTLVETALSLTLLFTLIIGVIELSWALYSYHFVSDAAREGSRYAMVRGADWSSSCDAGSGYASAGCTASPADVGNYIQSLNFPGIFITSKDVFVCYATALPSTPMAACTTNAATTSVPAAGGVVEVTISYPFKFAIPGFPGYTYTLTSSSQMVIAQ